MSPRPFRCRRISSEAPVKYFKPRGIPLFELEEVVLTPDEVEALKLADFDCLYQADAAEKMGISRQTFGNIINSAHRKVADAILNGKAVCIEGGYEKVLLEKLECPKCSYKWEADGDGVARCPECGNAESINRTQLKHEFSFNPGRCRRGRGGDRN